MNARHLAKKATAPLACAIAALGLTGYSISSTDSIIWEYYGTPLANTQYTYSPTSAYPTFQEFTTSIPSDSGIPSLPSNLMDKIGESLPEGMDVRSSGTGIQLDSDDRTNILFSEEAEVWVTFLKEGAGYRNSVGFFEYDQTSPPTAAGQIREKILFPDVSMPFPLQAATTTGNTAYLGRFAAGKALGMALVANGFRSDGRTSSTGAKIGGVNEKANRDWIFYTLRNLNPEVKDSRNLNVHTVILKDLNDSQPGYQRLVIGMEDINRVWGGDHDFNDVVMAIHVKPRTAISNLNTLGNLGGSGSNPDSDGDGIPDALDEYPTDPNRSYTRSYPDKNSWGTLGFEDEWPKRGDYDMNDLVVRYRTTEVLNTERKVVELQIDYKIDARGAMFSNGFSVHLPGIAASSIASATLSRVGATPVPITSESGSPEAVFNILHDSLAVTPDNGCYFFNTSNGCAKQIGRPYQLKVSFTSPQTSFPTSPYNPFIYRTAERGRETHLPGMPPTALANRALFGTLDDRSNLSTNYTYMDNARLPWAIDVPHEWQYPSEQQDMVSAYMQMVIWAASGGSNNKDWYLHGNANKVFLGK